MAHFAFARKASTGHPAAAVAPCRWLPALLRSPLLIVSLFRCAMQACKELGRSKLRLTGKQHLTDSVEVEQVARVNVSTPGSGRLHGWPACTS